MNNSRPVLETILAVVVICIMLTVIIGLSRNSFGARCSQAGYHGAELELCVRRATNGGPIYIENVEHWESTN